MYMGAHDFLSSLMEHCASNKVGRIIPLTSDVDSNCSIQLLMVFSLTVNEIKCGRETVIKSITWVPLWNHDKKLKVVIVEQQIWYQY